MVYSSVLMVPSGSTVALGGWFGLDFGAIGGAGGAGGAGGMRDAAAAAAAAKVRVCAPTRERYLQAGCIILRLLRNSFNVGRTLADENENQN